MIYDSILWGEGGRREGKGGENGTHSFELKNKGKVYKGSWSGKSKRQKKSVGIEKEGNSGIPSKNSKTSYIGEPKAYGLALLEKGGRGEVV